MMSKSSDDGYIKNGLIFHLDALNKGTTDGTKWVDLIGGIEFGGTDAWGDNYRMCSTANYMVATGFTEPVISANTMEIVFRFGNAYNRQLYNPNIRAGNNFCIAKGGDYICFTNNSSVKQAISLTDAPLGIDHIISYYRGKVVVDGEEKSLTTYDFFFGMSDNTTRIGHATGRLYAIRFYNRLLTTDEMLHNQRVDNERFNLGLNI